ncbi:homoserine kinase [Pseudobacter ginsenosidimutans]|uniref:Homoserine kinase n=1 Tax=Pseudobacter ginsenosidimutans TaxID=661488 RepID=A0A4Q7MQD9_9BACT|nr:homoserine kinase [Pseudobacter ginsenosidimutans]QEC40443.1 homoserine kinase [Pseudobacter ginsenosidimutans]RZS68949.1 homoserine kinase [Pseudobacter ginsenosidimutans]
MSKSVQVHAPATVANLVCGFDVLGMALHRPDDVMTLTLKEEPGITIEHTDIYQLPTEPEKNVAGAALLAMLEELDHPPGFHLVTDKRIKPGSGLGSSAASSAGAVVAANELLGKPFSNEDLVRFAMNGEKVASGVKHADNIAPAIYGGITLIRSIFPLDIVQLSGPPLFVTVVHPQIEVRTADARQILRKEVQLKSAIKQWGNIAGLVAGLLKQDYALIGRSLEDVIIEPVRSILIPGFDDVKSQSREAGALGGGISGSGPSIFMLSEKESTANAVEQLMQDVYTKLGIDFKTYVTSISYEGVRVSPVTVHQP